MCVSVWSFCVAVCLCNLLSLWSLSVIVIDCLRWANWAAAALAARFTAAVHIAWWISRMFMTSCLIRSVQTKGECFNWAGACGPARNRIWKRWKKTSGWTREHGSIKQTRGVMAKEVTEWEETDREESGGESCDLWRRKARKIVCARYKKEVRHIWAIQNSTYKERWGEIDWL